MRDSSTAVRAHHTDITAGTPSSPSTTVMLEPPTRPTSSADKTSRPYTTAPWTSLWNEASASASASGWWPASVSIRRRTRSR